MFRLEGLCIRQETFQHVTPSSHKLQTLHTTCPKLGLPPAVVYQIQGLIGTVHMRLTQRNVSASCACPDAYTAFPP